MWLTHELSDKDVVVVLNSTDVGDAQFQPEISSAFKRA